MMTRILASAAAAAATLMLATPTAEAASVNVIPPGWATAPGGAHSSGVGFCLSQVAQHPEYIGQSSLGAGMSANATSGPGTVPAMIDETRYPLCGGPGSGE